MIILHEYPLSIVEHYSFQRFVRALQPLFMVVPNNSTKNDVISVYEMERTRARELVCVTQGGIAVTADIWTSDGRNRGYTAIKAHFIDQSWTFQSHLFSADVKSELDKYLDEPVIPRTVDFDILDWRKIMGMRYPTLQMIARDILAVPFSRVACESAFCINGRVSSPQHSKLSSETLEALMCSQDWLRAEKKDAGSSGLLSYLTCLEDVNVSDGGVMFGWPLADS